MIEKKSRRSSSKGKVPMYELKITLPGNSVWRKVLVRGYMNLGLLHAIIQVAMGWTNSHLHQFAISGNNYSDPITQDDISYGLPVSRFE
jgi:hypothetical protein